MLGANKKPGYVGNNKIIFLNRGYNINIKGEAEKVFFDDIEITNYAVQPGNYRGVVPIPKVVVEIGDKVKAGDLLFYDKKIPELKFVSPVSGEVSAIRRGARRSIKEVVVTTDHKMEYKVFNSFDLNSGSREQLVDHLMETGVWPLIRQRPYDLIPDKDIVPKNIFISTFDTSPLAPDMDFIIKGREGKFQKGLDVLTKLTEGKVYLGLNANGESSPSDAFKKASGVEKVYFKGKHPAGNVGVQIHHLAPIKGEDKIWVLGVQDVVTIGNLFLNNTYDAERIIAITGEEVVSAKYLKSYLGADVSETVKVCIKDLKCRVISGNILTGETKMFEEYLNAFDSQVTIIPEGDDYVAFGWLISQKPTPTYWNAFMDKWFGSKKRQEVDSNMNGQKRAFVATGIYEKVVPMDIYPVHLMKAILAGDIEQMEGLGINELAEEDIALCEFICPSKQEFQAILRDGHRMMIEQA